jgi:hypothetical protein
MAVLALYLDILNLHAHLPAFILVTFLLGVLLLVFRCSFLYDDEFFYSMFIELIRMLEFGSYM